MNRVWTKRGEMHPADNLTIGTMVQQNPAAGRIFITGEVSVHYIGDAAVRLLLNSNDPMAKSGIEPLFIETKDETVRMTRFDPESVWKSINNPDLLTKLVQEEGARLGVPVDPWRMDIPDFYMEMAETLKGLHGLAIPSAKEESTLEEYHNSVYLSCLLLYGKPNFMDIPVAQYFAQPDTANWLRNVEFKKIDAKDVAQLFVLKETYGKIQGLTNPEMQFVVEFYQRGG